jgi:phosphatidylinositol alpha-1,6-mannosyltransferase
VLARELIRHRRHLRRATVYLPGAGADDDDDAAAVFPRLSPSPPHADVSRFGDSQVCREPPPPLAGRQADSPRHAGQHPEQLHPGAAVSHFPGAAEKIFLTPGALRSDFAVVALETDTPRKKIVILTVGRLHPRKGQLLTLQALQMLAPDVRTRIEYWVVGGQSKGNYEAHLRAAAAEKPDLTVRFFGNMPDEELSTIYDRSDIFAMTSVNLDRSVEGFGLVYLEAAAHGLPVVAHDVGGVAEAVMDGVTGLLVPPGDRFNSPPLSRNSSTTPCAAGSAPPAALGPRATAGKNPPPRCSIRQPLSTTKHDHHPRTRSPSATPRPT